MKVLIVARTRMKSGLCIGGLTSDGRNVRLIRPEGRHREDAPYEVGSIWEMELHPVPFVQPPHIEDHLIVSCQLVGTARHAGRLVVSKVRPWRGGPRALFDGALRFRPSGPAYVASDYVPSGSVGFWIPDRPLTLVHTQYRDRYEYRDPRGSTALFAYVGCAAPAPNIPAGSLVRVSLARWWRPPAEPEADEVCYAQVSGWFEVT
jgi:ATP-dependent DNA helicase RecQ